MRKLFTTAMTLLFFIAPLALTREAGARPDQFKGDTSIYTAAGSSNPNRPNVLFVIDNSAGMTQPGTAKPYDPTQTYPGTYTSDTVYVRVTATGGTINYNPYIDSMIDNVTCNAALSSLQANGAYYGKLKRSNGSCNDPNQGVYVTGNLLNYEFNPIPHWQPGHAYAINDVVFPVAGGSRSYYCTNAGTSGSTEPAWTTTPGVTVNDGTAKWELRPTSILNMVQTTVDQVAVAVRDSANVGLMVFGSSNKGGAVVKPVLDITSATGLTNLTNLTNAVDSITLLGANTQPVNEALWDAGVYYGGNNSSVSLKIATERTSYPSPIQYHCQLNYIIVLTTGATDVDSNTKAHLTDLNGNGIAGDCAEAALYNYNPGVTIPFGGVARQIPLQTYVVQLLTPQVDMLVTAAELGHGKYYPVHDTRELAAALLDAMSNIVLSANTSFVAPVVPVSPENKVYTGNRVYMGFFKPMNTQYWYGNLKKYALDANSNIIDKNGAFANYVDQDFNFIDDRDPTQQDRLPQGAQNGSFRSSAQSYWLVTSPTVTADGGVVNSGGAGAVLQNRSFSVSCPTCDITGDVRRIYTYLGTNTNLADPSNAFSTQNVQSPTTPTGLLTASILGLPGDIIGSGTTDDVKQLVNFVHGIDVYNEAGNLPPTTTEKRAWLFGDVLHSKPFVMNYASYTFNETTESECTTNKTMIFVGSNDGMVHAVNDCDGTEAWAFIPPDLLPYLQYLHGDSHTYFVDSTIYAYVYDNNKDGTIDVADGDKVILLVGMRRGGGILGVEPTQGYYYALDVSERASPKLLWSISNNSIRKGLATTPSTTYTNLGEAWSEPKLIRVSVGSPATDKIVMVIGGGYDNCNEDSRYGNTLLFSGSCVSLLTTDDGGLDASNNPKTSSGTTAVGSLAAYKGRAIYVVELATLTAGVPDFTNSGDLVRAFTAPLEYSMLSEMTALDTDFDGYADKLYMGDTGGNVWRFNVKSTTPSNWTATKIFTSNSGYTNGSPDSTTGRKIFYKFSAVVDTGGMVRLYFGTGDREHPLNRAVTDRIYEVIDKGQTSAVTEAQLVDVTEDQLQTTTDPTLPAFQDLLANLAAANEPGNTGYYGWYIRLDQNSGEKVLAGATVYNKVVYYSTYAPDTALVTDPCQIGNLGTARIYVVDYQNGSAVMNFDTSNDSQFTTYKTNTYATPTSAGGNVLLRSDRLLKIGAGIPSGVVVTGDKVLIGCGGGICTTSTNVGGQVLPVYWRQR